MSNPFDVQTVRCAGPGCDHVRQSCNHWFVVQVSDRHFSCQPLMVDTDKVRLIRLDETAQPACGSACAQKLFEQFLSK